MTMTMSVEMPDAFSIELRSLLTGLLQRDVNKRLGCRGRGAEELKSHPFFRGIDWRTVLLQRLTPPLIPARGEVNAADAFDIGSFDDEDTKHIRLTDADQELYRNFPVVVSERWQQEIAETIFDHINHEADKAEMKRKSKNKLGYQEEEQSDCILHGYIKRLGGTFTATWLTRYVRLYPNRLELWSDSGRHPELIFMDQIEEVCNDYVQIKNEQCIVIKLYNHTKYVFTNSDEIGLREWHNSLKAAYKESLDMMTRMADKATKIYGTEIPLKHMGKRRQQLQHEANLGAQMNIPAGDSVVANQQQALQQQHQQQASASISGSTPANVGSENIQPRGPPLPPTSMMASNQSKIANLEQKTIQRELEDSSKRRGICRKANSLNQPARHPFPIKQASERIHSTSGSATTAQQQQQQQRSTTTATSGAAEKHQSSSGHAHFHSHGHSHSHHQHSRRAHHHRHHHHRATVSSSGVGAGATSGGSQHHHHHHHHHHRHSASTRSARAKVKTTKQSTAAASGQPDVADRTPTQLMDQTGAELEHSKQFDQATISAEGRPIENQQQQQGAAIDAKSSRRPVNADDANLMTGRGQLDQAEVNKEKTTTLNQHEDDDADSKTIVSSRNEQIDAANDSDANRKLSGSSVQSEEGATDSSTSYDESSSTGSASGSCASDNTLADAGQQQTSKTGDALTAASASDGATTTTDKPNQRELLLLTKTSLNSTTSGLVPSDASKALGADAGKDEEAMTMQQNEQAEEEEEEEDVDEFNEPVCIKLAVSLENVNESQEVLRDPSKRITSDNKQREQDLVAQYEKLNINSLNSSSSIEE